MPQVDSLNDVVSTVTRMTRAFERMVENEMPGTTAKFDEDLDYLAALRHLRADNDNNGEGESGLPMLVYNRTVLEDSEVGPSKRMKSHTGFVRVGDSSLKFSACHAQTTINFIFVTDSIRTLEQFEVAYLSDEGISEYKELTVDMGADIGDFKYFLNFEPLSEMNFRNEEVDYKAVAGSIIVRGMYFTFKGRNSIIKEIVTKIYRSRVLNEKTELLYDSICVGVDDE